MEKVTDPGGYYFLIKRVPEGVRMEGFGPRGASLGSAILLEETINEIQFAMRDERGKLISQDPVRTRGSFNPGLYIIAPVIDELTRVYLSGPRGGWRKPVRLRDQDTLIQLTEAIKSCRIGKRKRVKV